MSAMSASCNVSISWIPPCSNAKRQPTPNSSLFDLTLACPLDPTLEAVELGADMHVSHLGIAENLLTN